MTRTERQHLASVVTNYAQQARAYRRRAKREKRQALALIAETMEARIVEIANELIAARDRANARCSPFSYYYRRTAKQRAQAHRMSAR
jgi:hypothetical protein